MPAKPQEQLSVPSSSSTSSWHQISPSTRPLNLEILEITSLSLTIALSLAPRPIRNGSLNGNGSGPARRISQNRSSLVSGLTHPPLGQSQARSRRGDRSRARLSVDSDDELTAVEDNTDERGYPAQMAFPADGSITPGSNQSESSHGRHHAPTNVPGGFPSPSPRNTSPHPSFKDLLSKGVVVTVNGKPWTMIVAHVDEDESALHHLREDAIGESSTSEAREQGRSNVGETSSHSTAPRHRAGAAAHHEAGRDGLDLGDDAQHTRMDNMRADKEWEMDRAIVVIYGLEPGKEYEVDLKVIGNLNAGGEDGPIAPPNASASASIITPAVHSGVSSGNRSRANSLRNRPNGTRSRSSSLIQTAMATNNTPAAVTSGVTLTLGGVRPPPDGMGGTANADLLANANGQSSRRHSREASDGIVQEGVSASGGSSGGANPTETPLERTGQDDTRGNHLRHLVQTATGERDDLATQLKKSRRESQKLEASLRSDIEALKKSMEKTILPDQRSRQKSLALQEQVKQALAGATEADKEQRLIEEGMDHLAVQEGEVRGEWEQAKEERDKANAERDKALEEMKRAIVEIDSDLTAINVKLEKQLARRERIVRENQELQQKLEDVASARSEVEKRNEAISRRRLVAEDYPNIRPHGSLPASRSSSGPSAAGWDNDDVWTVNPAAASRPNLARGSGGAAQAGILPFGVQNGMSSQPSYSSTDLHQLGRQAGGPSYNARPFWPTNVNASRNSAGPSMPPVAAAALATQGIPKAATMGVSHMGNPTGFFPVAQQTATASSAAASVNRTYQSRPTAIPASGFGATSPLIANVNAAPFMPSQQPVVPNDTVGQSSNSSDQHTSLVPPQLQHRIFLPGNRRIPSPSASQTHLGLGAMQTSKPAIGNGQLVAESSQTSPIAATPSFPPLPSSKLAPIPSASYKAGMGTGPSLASIVTRAIIPTNSVLHVGNPGAQKSPVTMHADVQSHYQGARPSPPSSRPSSYYGRGENSDSSLGGKIVLTPQAEESDHFPPLPISPSNAWVGHATPPLVTTFANARQGTVPSLGVPVAQSSASPWVSKVPSRRGSEVLGHGS